MCLVAFSNIYLAKSESGTNLMKLGAKILKRAKGQPSAKDLVPGKVGDWLLWWYIRAVKFICSLKKNVGNHNQMAARFKAQ